MNNEAHIPTAEGRPLTRAELKERIAQVSPWLGDMSWFLPTVLWGTLLVIASPTLLKLGRIMWWLITGEWTGK